MRLFLCFLLGGFCASCALAQTAYDGRVALKSAPLPSQVRKDIVAAIAADYALTSWVSFPQLTPNGKGTILVTAGPDDPDTGATGNGDLWLFRQVGNHAVLILKGGGSGYGPTGAAYHNGMHDFQTAWNMSCCSGGVEVYRYDGQRYKPAYCYSYETDDDGNMKEGPHGRCEE